MTATKGIRFEGRFFWAYDVAAGVFLKHLIDEAQASEHADELWLSKAVSSWRVQAAVTECGLTLEEDWSSAQRQIFIKLAEAACKKLATRELIPASEVANWPLVDELGIHPRTKTEILTAPVIELGHAIIALVSGNLPRPPKGEAWFYGTPAGRSTIRMMGGDDWEDQLFRSLAKPQRKPWWRRLLRGQVKRLCFEAEPRDCFNPEGDWVVMAYNLDDSADVQQVGGPFASEAEAQAEARRLGTLTAG